MTRETIVTLLSIVLALIAYIGARTLPVKAGEPEIIFGLVTDVRDGDTIVVGDLPIRLKGITADELGTPLGDEAAINMALLALGQAVECELTGEVSHDRSVGYCYAHGYDLGATQIKAGFATRCEAFDPDRRYAEFGWVTPYTGEIPPYCTPTM